MARSADVGTADEVVEIDVFTVGSDGALVPLDPGVGGEDDEPLLDVWATGVETLGPLRDFRARPGHRLGPAIGRSRRRGHHEEIAQPVGVRPYTATEVVLSGDLFVEPIPSLEVDGASRTLEGDSVRWKAFLRTGPLGRRRTATLYLHPSPSANLSVIELIPSKRRRIQTQRFVRAGVIAVDVLGRRLRCLATERFSTPGVAAGSAAPLLA